MQNICNFTSVMNLNHTHDNNYVHKYISNIVNSVSFLDTDKNLFKLGVPHWYFQFIDHKHEHLFWRILFELVMFQSITCFRPQVMDQNVASFSWNCSKVLLQCNIYTYCISASSRSLNMFSLCKMLIVLHYIVHVI